MSRLRHYAHGLASGYIALLGNVVYTLLSIRLALEYLPTAEFGVWAVSAQIAAYFGFVDLGMGASLARLLIDHKDRRENGEYGGMIKTGMLVFLCQGAIVFLVGWWLALVLPAAMEIPDGLKEMFERLLFGLAVLSGLSFQTKVFGLTLYANQRMDLQNIGQLLQFAVGLAALWTGLREGAGVYSLLWAQFAAWLAFLIFAAAVCWLTGTMPKRGGWGRASSERFRRIFQFGADLFLVALGTQLIGASQVMVVGAVLGVETAAVWAVATKAFTLVCQALIRFSAVSGPGFAEMYVRGERDRLWTRYTELFRLGAAFSVLCGVVFAACNSAFIELWTGRSWDWLLRHDILLAIWLIPYGQQGFHNNLLLVVKEIRALKFIYLAEGLAFVMCGGLAARHLGEWALIATAIVSTTLFSFTYGVFRIREIMKTPVRNVLWEWQKPMLAMLAVALPLGVVGRAVLVDQGADVRFFGQLALVGGIGGLFFARVVVPPIWRAKILGLAPVGMRAALGRLAGVQPATGGDESSPGCVDPEQR